VRRQRGHPPPPPFLWDWGATLGNCSPPGAGPSLGLAPLGTCGPPRDAAAPQGWGSPWDHPPWGPVPPRVWGHPWGRPWGSAHPGSGPPPGSAPCWGRVPSPESGSPGGSVAPSQARSPPGDWDPPEIYPLPAPLRMRVPSVPRRGPGAPPPTPLQNSGGAAAAARPYRVACRGRGLGGGRRAPVPPWALWC